jgi:hypothetical protein
LTKSGAAALRAEIANLKRLIDHVEQPKGRA